MKLLCWLTLATSLSAHAGVFTETFTSTTQKASSTLVWNFELGYLHPELQIIGYRNSSQPVASQTTFSVSDGSHGSFEPSTYSRFGTVVGNHITVDANQFPVLKVTRFYLDSTHTLSSVNGPLIIHSLSTVDIDGTIQCFGENGSPAVGTTGGAGGIGRCAGFAGGQGGNATASGTNGSSLSGTSIGGSGGVYNSTSPQSGGGGGGGAGYVSNPGTAGANPVSGTNTGGAGGTPKSGLDHGFEILVGSGGGGGGSGSNTEGGGGGGGGGGTVIIRAVGAVTISTTGAILAYGGNGGSANSGGGGGGGSGGNISIFTPTTYHCALPNIVIVSGGSGAIPIIAGAGDGGAGSFGRTWDVGIFSGAVGETHGSSLAVDGTVGFVSGTAQTAISKSFDTQSTLVTYQSITANPTNSSISFEVAASNDDFTNDDSGWINANLITTLVKKRYIKYRIIVNNSNATTPTLVDDVFINYEIGIKEDFSFKSSGCGIVKNSSPQNFQWLVTLFLFFPMILAWRLRTKTAQVLTKK